jgi:hypothetical protein
VHERVPFHRAMGKESDASGGRSKTGRMMVEMQELMGVANMYKPREEQKRVEATQQAQRDMEQAAEQTRH